MGAIDKIEARAAARAIHKTVRMIEEEFDVKAKGSTAKQKRQSVLRALRRRYKLRKRHRR